MIIACSIRSTNDSKRSKFGNDFLSMLWSYFEHEDDPEDYEFCSWVCLVSFLTELNDTQAFRFVTLPHLEQKDEDFPVLQDFLDFCAKNK